MKKLKPHNPATDGELTFFKGKDRDVFLTALAGPETKKGYTAKMMLFDILFVDERAITPIDILFSSFLSTVFVDV